MENRKPILEVNGCIEEPLTTFDLELRALTKKGPPGITMSLLSPARRMQFIRGRRLRIVSHTK